MTDGDDKSMDDVLASIRRIVRAEKESGVATATGEEPFDEAGRPSADEAPLMLTPEMRADTGSAHAPGRPELAADTAEASGAGNESLDRVALGAAVREILPEILPELLPQLLPELLRGELTGGPAEQAVRGIIRDELTSGQVGRNISQNVLRLIRDEVAKAVQASR